MKPVSSTPPDGLIAVVKEDCPTCRLVEPVLQQLGSTKRGIVVYTQDDPTFPCDEPQVIDDRTLNTSFDLEIETVPTLIRHESGQEAERVVGWNRADWQRVTAIADLGEELPAHQPGCGSRSIEPGATYKLRARFGDTGIRARRIQVDQFEDEIATSFDRCWNNFGDPGLTF